MKTKENKTKVFDLTGIGFTDLQGRFVSIDLGREDFANNLFVNAKSIDMDNFAREIHKDGKAELTDRVRDELLDILPTIYVRRVSEAIKDKINKL